MTYYFSVVNGYLSCTNSRKTIISDMVNVHVAHFTLDSSWVGYDKTATFLNTKTNVKKDIVLGVDVLDCLIPWESLVAELEGGYLVVGLTGYKDGKILRTKMYNPLLIEKSDIDDGDNPLPPTPDVYEQIMDLIASLGGAYVLPIASSNTLGGIKVGSNLSIDSNGVLSASSGGVSDYTLLSNKPSINNVTLSGNKTTSDLGIVIPTKTSDLSNDSGFITKSVNDLTNYTKTSSLSTVATSGSYLDLSNKPSIPTKTSDLSNDSGFLTSVPTATNSTKGIVQADGTTTTITDGVISAIGGGGGTSDYSLLSNKPSINGVTLSGNKTTSDLGITIPTKTSELSNDSNFIVDSNYVHTDNNYTTTEKNKLSGISENANNYSLPTASDSVLGGIKIGSGLNIDGSGVVTPNFPVTSVNTKTGTVSLTTDDVSATLSNRYVPSIPLTTPETKYLNGNGEFADIVVSSSGYINNVYLSNVNSDISTYKTLSYAIDLTEVEKQTTVSSGGGEILSGVYLYPSAIGVDTINSGTWSMDINAKVSSISGGSTVLRYEFFVRRTDNTEATLFSKTSSPITSTSDYELSISTVINQVFSISATDRLGVRIYASTTRVSSTIVSYIIGDGRGSYFTIPLALRHSQLRDKNEEENFQHITTAQKTVLGNTSGTNTGDETNSTILTKIGYTPENVANKGQSLGYCGLDSGGKVPLGNLPSTLLKYVGVWNASTNTPTLTNPDATKIGNVYNVSVAGTQFGINFSLGDWLIYNSSGVPEKSDNSDDVVSVNSKTGNVVLTTADIADSNDKRYVTEAEKTKLSNLSGTNSGNETTTTIGTLVNGATVKTTAVDADMIPLMDSGASNIIKKFSWANIKATLKTYFDTIYSKGDIYVLAESVVGSYNGKPLYRKGITVASLPNTTNTSYAHGASNIEYILRTYGATTDGTNFRPVPFVFASNIAASISLYATTTNIVIETATNRSALSGVFYIEYTKTTD